MCRVCFALPVYVSNCVDYTCVCAILCLMHLLNPGNQIRMTIFDWLDWHCLCIMSVMDVKIQCCQWLISRASIFWVTWNIFSLVSLKVQSLCLKYITFIWYGIDHCGTKWSPDMIVNWLNFRCIYLYVVLLWDPDDCTCQIMLSLKIWRWWFNVNVL